MPFAPDVFRVLGAVLLQGVHVNPAVMHGGSHVMVGEVALVHPPGDGGFVQP